MGFLNHQECQVSTKMILMSPLFIAVVFKVYEGTSLNLRKGNNIGPIAVQHCKMHLEQLLDFIPFGRSVCPFRVLPDIPSKPFRSLLQPPMRKILLVLATWPHVMGGTAAIIRHFRKPINQYQSPIITNHSTVFPLNRHVLYNKA